MDIVDYFFEALLVQLNKQIIKSTTFLEEDNFRSKIQAATSPNIPDGIVNDVISFLRDEDFILVISDEIGGRFVKLNYARVNTFVNAKADDPSSFMYRYQQIGAPLLRRIADHFDPNHADQNQNAPAEELSEEVPAADRIVRLDDNSALRDEIVAKVDELQGAVRGENDEEGKLGEERGRILAELDAGRDLLKAPTVRLRAVLAVLGVALTFIATEFAGGIIGELAVELLEKLKPLLGL